MIKTPDPGVIEVKRMPRVQLARSGRNTHILYEEGA